MKRPLVVCLAVGARDGLPQDTDATIKAMPKGYPPLTAPLHVRVATGQIPGGISIVGYADSGAAVGGGLGDAGQTFSGAAGLVVVAYSK